MLAPPLVIPLADGVFPSVPAGSVVSTVSEVVCSSAASELSLDPVTVIASVSVNVPYSPEQAATASVRQRTVMIANIFVFILLLLYYITNLK